MFCFVRFKSTSCFGPNFQGLFFLSNFLSGSVYSEYFGKNLAMYCVAPRNDFNFFVFFSGFNYIISSNFSSFGFILSPSISCQSHFVLFMKSSDFFLLARYPIFPSLISTSKFFLVFFFCLPGLLLLYRSTMPMYNTLMSGQFFPGISSVYLRVHRILF